MKIRSSELSKIQMLEGVIRQRNKDIDELHALVNNQKEMIYHQGELIELIESQQERLTNIKRNNDKLIKNQDKIIERQGEFIEMVIERIGGSLTMHTDLMNINKAHVVTDG